MFHPAEYIQPAEAGWQRLLRATSWIRGEWPNYIYGWEVRAVKKSNRRKYLWIKM